MKCENCGAPIGLEDKFCAYCGAPNPHFLKHQADMEHYEKEFVKTQTEVMKSTGRMARISSNLIILAILVVLNIIAVVFAFSATDLAWNAREQAQKKKYWRDAQIDYWLHLPHRIGRKLLGDRLYERIKRVFGR